MSFKSGVMGSASSVNRPPIIHQPCGKPVVRTTGSMRFREYYRCESCNVTLLWPNVDMQYEKTKPPESSKNRVVVTIQSFYEDTPNPISTEFPIDCHDTRQVEAISNRMTRLVRNILESMNVETA